MATVTHYRDHVWRRPSWSHGYLGRRGAGYAYIGDRRMRDRLISREPAHRGLITLLAVKDLHRRKVEMFMRSDVFLALLAAIGSMEEFFEQWTWAQLGIHPHHVRSSTSMAILIRCCA